MYSIIELRLSYHLQLCHYPNLDAEFGDFIRDDQQQKAKNTHFAWVGYDNLDDYRRRPAPVGIPAGDATSKMGE